MSAELVDFVGYTDAQHVHQPEESELCFAAIMAAMTDASWAEAHVDLVSAGVSERDGSTSPWLSEKTLEIGDSTVTLTPFQNPLKGAEDVEGVMALIDEQFVAGRAVTLLHKRNGQPDDDRHHWTLLTGYLGAEGEPKGPIHVIDPLEHKGRYLNRSVVASMIEQSLNFQGVYAYAVTAEEAEPTIETSRAERMTNFLRVRGQEIVDFFKV